MADGGEQPGDVVVVESGDGVAQADRDAACEAGGQQEDASFAAGVGEFAARRRTAFRSSGWRSASSIDELNRRGWRTILVAGAGREASALSPRLMIDIRHWRQERGRGRSVPGNNGDEPGKRHGTD